MNARLPSLSLKIALMAFFTVEGSQSAHAQSASTGDSAKPNIVFILADNLGYGCRPATTAASSTRPRRASTSSPLRGCD